MTAAGSRESADVLELETDVLVVGGGPAAVWAALTARAEGARVLLVDKGFCGSSGVAAAATAGHWWVPPDKREEAITERDALGHNLSERSWMERVLEETWRRWPEVGGDVGYPGGSFPGLRSPGAIVCQGPIYLREMRRRVSHSGVRILDHSPALELLVDADGAVCGAAGVQRQKARPWRARAGAVILATGGCCWRSGALGSNVDTGDGYLMAAEVGATLSGMEFSNYYGIVPAGGSMDKNGFYAGATFTDADGNVLAAGFMSPGGIGGPGTWLLEAVLHGPVYAIFDRAPAEAWPKMRAQMPNFFVAFDRHGIDPFRQRFEIEYILEGTTRGTGGLRITDDTCSTGVQGLWAAGDAVSREAIVGSASGAGSPNAAFTISSGTWSGRAAAAHALSASGAGGRSKPAAQPAGRVGLRPTGARLPEGSWRELSRATQDEILPPAKNGFRSTAQLTRSLAVLDDLWGAAGAGLAGSIGREQVWARETASMIVNARWAYTSAERREETRGMHQRTDFPDSDPSQRHRILISGTDELEVDFAAIADPLVPYGDELVAEAA
ncbi:MAG TPA: FAD-binding protein [Solirubrobacteraceae bacterium]|nr:FAD-binding protein [Solirubrobacteraceae bacterium]